VKADEIKPGIADSELIKPVTVVADLPVEISFIGSFAPSISDAQPINPTAVGTELPIEISFTDVLTPELIDSEKTTPSVANVGLDIKPVVGKSMKPKPYTALNIGHE